MAARQLIIHSAFYRRLRHYQDRIGKIDGRPQVAERLVLSTRELVLRILETHERGHSGRFESPELADIMRMSVPGFPVFAVFYRWNKDSVTI